MERPKSGKYADCAAEGVAVCAAKGAVISAAENLAVCAAEILAVCAAGPRDVCAAIGVAVKDATMSLSDLVLRHLNEALRFH